MNRGEAIQWMRGLVRISTGKAIQWRGSDHSLNRRTPTAEKLLSSSPSRHQLLGLGESRTLVLPHCNSSEFRVRNAFAPYRGQNPQNREQRVSESKIPISHHSRNRSESKNPHFYTDHYRKNGDFLSRNTLFWAGGKWDFLTPNLRDCSSARTTQSQWLSISISKQATLKSEGKADV